MNPHKSFTQILKDTGKFFLISLVLLLPIVGVKLSGWKFSYRFTEAATLILGLTALKFIVELINLSQKLGPSFRKIFSQRINLPQVSQEHFSLKNKLLLAGLLVFCFALPFFTQQYWLSVMITALIYVLLGLGLNIVIGFAGMLDLGYVAFYAVGAYTVALLFRYFQLDFWISLPLAAALATIVGATLAFPVLRMHGDYLAIVTLGFGEIIRLVLNNWTEFTQGPNGVRLPRPFITFFGIPFSENESNSFHNIFNISYDNIHKSIFIYLCLLIICVLTIYFCLRLKQMPLGRSWEALRENEVACRSLGINHVKIKLAAFALGALFGGIGGGFFATLTEFVSPSSFTFIESALVVAIVVLGGLGSVPGVVVAAVVMTFLPEVLRDIANVRILLFGVIMVIMMIWRPRGLTIVTRPRFNRSNTDKK